MSEKHTREEILNALSKVSFGCVATLESGKIRLRTMHFASDENLNFYFASMKNDPKIRQLKENPSLSFHLTIEDEELIFTSEIEAVGRAHVIHEEEREKALKLLYKSSPIVKVQSDAKNTEIFDVFKLQPKSLKYRVFGEIVRGVAPTVFEFEPQAKVESYFTINEKVRLWFSELRVPFLTASIIPIILGSAIAWSKTGEFYWFYFLLTLFGGVLLHAGTNVANDFFDHLSRDDWVNTEYVRPFSGGSRMIQRGLLSPKEVLAGALTLFSLGSLIGFYLVFERGFLILYLGMIGVFSGFFYTAPPIKLANRGIGELFVGLNFGILMTLGAYYVQTQRFDLEPLVASIPIALLIALVLYINEFPDFTADREVGKRTLVVRLGKEKAARFYEILMLITYLSIILGVALRLVPPFVLLGLLTLPKAIRAVRVAKTNYEDTINLVPANAETIMVHLFTGILISLGYVLQRLIPI
ncbi:MAG: 1,4-dihydroxy-2-naphthoate octaprenyltransferase [Candidatus Methanofastidiosia archaeon]